MKCCCFFPKCIFKTEEFPAVKIDIFYLQRFIRALFITATYSLGMTIIQFVKILKGKNIGNVNISHYTNNPYERIETRGEVWNDRVSQCPTTESLIQLFNRISKFNNFIFNGEHYL